MKNTGSNSLKRLSILAIALLLFVYAIAPFISGLLNYPDRRGPLIYPAGYHEMLHTIGRTFVERGATKIPRTERPWFYGMAGKPIDLNALQHHMMDVVNQDRGNTTNEITNSLIENSTNR